MNRLDTKLGIFIEWQVLSWTCVDREVAEQQSCGQWFQTKDGLLVAFVSFFLLRQFYLHFASEGCELCDIKGNRFLVFFFSFIVQ